MTNARTILLVDDDEDFRDLIRDVLTGKGFQVVTAADGREALAKLPSLDEPLLLVDLMMPGMNGWELIESLRHSPYAHLPIIVLSAAAQAPEDLPFLPKPVALSELVDEVEARCPANGQRL